MGFRITSDRGATMPRCGCITSSTYTASECAAWFGVSALPTVVFNEKVSLVGAVPEESYRWLLDWLLAGEPGGIIPLHVQPQGPESAGQSSVADTLPPH